MNTLFDLINSWTPQQWYLFGGLIASIPGTYFIVEYVKRHHFKKTAQDLWSGFVVLNVLVWGTVLTAVDALTANFSQLNHIGSLIPQIAPWVAVWGPRVSAALLVIHIVATTCKRWFDDRKAHKALSTTNLPDLKPLVDRVNSPVSITDINPAAPPQDVFSL